jgi:hypothetical protein
MEQPVVCKTCHCPLNITQLHDSGYTYCVVCGSRYVPHETLALTFIDEIPLEEYNGG